MRLRYLLFAGFCALQGSIWLLSLPELSVVSQAGWTAIAAGVLVLLTFSVDQSNSPQKKFAGEFILPSLLAFAVPQLLFSVGANLLSTLMGTAVLAAVPVIVCVVGGVFETADAGTMVSLLPSMMAFGGLLLLLPVVFPASNQGRLGLAVYVAAACSAAIGSVLFFRRVSTASGRIPRRVLLRTAAAANAGLFALIWPVLKVLSTPTPDQAGFASPWSALVFCLVTLSGMAMLFDLLATMLPLALAARFIIIPLLATVEALVLLRPGLTWRAAAGALLGAMGAALLLRGSPERLESARMIPR